MILREGSTNLIRYFRDSEDGAVQGKVMEGAHRES